MQIVKFMLVSLQFWLCVGGKSNLQSTHSATLTQGHLKKDCKQSHESSLDIHITLYSGCVLTVTLCQLTGSYLPPPWWWCVHPNIVLFMITIYLSLIPPLVIWGCMAQPPRGLESLKIREAGCVSQKPGLAYQ